MDKIIYIVAAGPNVKVDYPKTLKEFGEHDTMAVNGGAFIVPFPTYIATLHASTIKKLLGFSEFVSGEKTNPIIIARKHKNEEDYDGEYTNKDWTYEGADKCGTSSLFAVDAAIELGYSKIILIGAPMTNERNIFKSDNHDYFDKYWPAWEAYNFQDKVRSVSGNTKELLGMPTKTWLNGGEE